MSENSNDTSVEESILGDEGAEVVETPEAEVPEAPTVPETVPYSRLSEVVQQREALRLEKERADFEVQQMRAALQQQQQELQRLRPAPVAATPANPWDTYQDPNAKALAQLVAQVQQHTQKPLQDKMDRLEVFLEQQENQNFWARYPQVPAEMQAKTNQIYANAKHMGIDRDTALTFAYGEAQRAALNGQTQAAATSVTTQAQVNRTARSAVAPAGAPAARSPNQTVTQASDILKQIEADLAKTRR